MRTTLNIDDEVMKFVMEETKASTKTEAVRKALDDYVRRRKIERLIALKGKVRFDVDWKTLRKGWTGSSKCIGRLWENAGRETTVVLVDTSVWIEYLDRVNPLVEGEMDQLLRAGEATTAGLVLGELRQGCRSERQVTTVLNAMEPLIYLEADRNAWLRAGELAAAGAARDYKLDVGDCLLAALALREDCLTFTLDRDFERIPGLKLHRPRVN